MWSFRGLPLFDSAEVMPPGSDVLVEAALQSPLGARIHEVGVGSGALLLSLALERPDLQLSGSDNSAAAVALTRRNLHAYGIRGVPISQSADLPEGVFDLVIANLPYLTRDEVDGDPLPGTVVDGNDPLAIIRSLIGAASAGQRLAIQHPLRLADAVAVLLSETHLLFPARDPSVTLGCRGE